MTVSNSNAAAVNSVDATHDPALVSWVPSANGRTEFPIQNLPLGIFSPRGGDRRGGIAIGDMILDLRATLAAGLLEGEARIAAEAASGETLNPLLALGAGPRAALRRSVSALLASGAPARADLLHLAAECVLHLPAHIGDYSDFYAGIQHATNAGSLMRPDTPLMPNYKYVPVGYHGRASSVRVSGVPVRRPNGQRKPAKEIVPTFGPSRNLDFELELGVWIGPGNAPGEPIPIGAAGGHIAGLCLLNDWSARDIQGWEAQPLGPFLAKSFATTVSPWIVTVEALAPFRVPQPARPEGDPVPLDYLHDPLDQHEGAFAIALEADLLTRGMAGRGEPAYRLTASHARYLYWTVAQLVAHHASGGCDLRPGDLFGSGTISGPDPGSFGSLLEITAGGRQPVTLPSGETRRFLEDGDEIILRARACRDGFVSIGFGECRAVIMPAHV